MENQEREISGTFYEIEKLSLSGAPSNIVIRLMGKIVAAIQQMKYEVIKE
mgnify:CR=1 FL=1